MQAFVFVTHAHILLLTGIAPTFGAPEVFFPGVPPGAPLLVLEWRPIRHVHLSFSFSFLSLFFPLTFFTFLFLFLFFFKAPLVTREG